MAKLGVGSDALQIHTPADEFAGLTSSAQVQALREQKLAKLDAAARTVNDNQALALSLQATRAAVLRNAARREAVLAGLSVSAQAEPTPRLELPVNGKAWDAHSNPVVLERWPGFVNNFINQRIGRIQDNLQRMGNDTGLYLKAVLTALPAALFVLVPVFALVLRVDYLDRRMGYLEHLVVALYSHAWLLLVVLATLLVSAVSASGDMKVGWLLSLLLWVCVPVYLLLMQQRVYGGRLWLSVLRYLGIGSVYVFMVGLVAAYAALAGIIS